MKIKLDPSLTGKAKYDFLIANKAAFVAQKKMPHWADVFVAPVDTKEIIKTAAPKDAGDNAGEVTETIPDPGTVEVKFYGNTCLYYDSQGDVLLPDSSKRTLQNNKALIQHLHDHIQKTDAIIGDMQDITIPYVSWNDLGVNFPGQTQVIYCDSIVREVYNEKLYNLYKNKRIKQHSIGLQYVQIALALSDPEYKEEYALWLKWIDKIANKDAVVAAGFFWAVAEIKLIEVSAVLYGANEITGVDTTNGAKSETKTVATYDDNDDADDLMYCDKMMRKHTKMIKSGAEYTGDNTEVKQAITNMTYNSTNSLNHLQQIKDKMLGSEKSIETDPLLDIQDHPHMISLKAINETKFINLN